MLEKVLRVGTVKSWLYLVAKPAQVGVDIDGTSCPLHHPSLVGVGLARRVCGSGRFFLVSRPKTCECRNFFKTFYFFVAYILLCIIFVLSRALVFESV
jgi:hypothetical protein